jgi:hypothetical protein
MFYADVKGRYHIIYPAADYTKLKVLFLQNALDYELNEYAVASHKYFYDFQSAEDYAKTLAKEHNLQYVSDNDNIILD